MPAAPTVPPIEAPINLSEAGLDLASGLYGDLDQGIPFDDVERLRGIAAARPVPTELVRYAEGYHGFNCDERASYDKTAADLAKSRTLEFFAKYF